MKKTADFQWRCRDIFFGFNERPLVMGILNVTPDSFSDGGRFFDFSKAVRRGMQMMEEGVDIIDVGGESTRPGASSIEEEEELKRVVPVIRELCSDPKVVVSIDTTKAGVAQKAIDAGARIINDVSALAGDPGMAEVAASTGAGAILMHMQGSPRTMQEAPVYGDVVGEVRDYLVARADDLVLKGVSRECLAVDPGIGFGKTLEHNISLLSGIRTLAAAGFPVAVGLSRKSFIGRLTGREVEDRLAGSLAGLGFCVLNMVHILRVHDVRESVDAVRVACALRNNIKSA